jgi:regulator of protease activity HflC (stomatin/prohibitin superfamily)
MKARRRLLCLVTLAVLAMALGGCTHAVPPASVGIKFNASSGISEKILKPQVLWIGPRDQLIVYPTSIRNATYTRASGEGERMGDDSIPASTSEGSILPVDITISYHVDPENVVRAFENFGTADLHQIQTDYIRWATIYAVNVVSGTHSIFDLTSKDRAGFGPEVKKELSPVLAGWGITVDDVNIGEVYPNEEVHQKVNERINTRNALELAKVSLQRANIDSQTILTNAKKDATINALLAQQGEKSLELRKLELQRQAIAKWDGKPPILGDSTIPFTDIQVH